MGTASNPAVAILERLPEIRSWQEDLYRDLHQHPELSHQEQRTASLVVDRLRGSGHEVHEAIGGTGVVGIMRNGSGPTVLIRADMDALPVKEATGLPYTSTARGMVDDGLADALPPADVALAQHVLPAPAGHVGTRHGPLLSAADSMRITVYGRGAHGSMPQAAVDPVVLAAMIVVRLQTVASREVAPTDTVVLTIGSIRAGSKSNVINDHAVLELNLRTYDESVRTAVLTAIRRIVIAEGQASDSPKKPEFERYDRFPLTVNDDEVTDRVSDAFAAYFGERFSPMPDQSASEDFSDIPNALGVPYSYWGFGGIDEQHYRTAARAGRIAQDIPVNHSPAFAPVIQPTLDTGTQALVVAALAWLAS